VKSEKPKELYATDMYEKTYTCDRASRWNCLSFLFFAISLDRWDFLHKSQNTVTYPRLTFTQETQVCIPERVHWIHFPVSLFFNLHCLWISRSFIFPQAK
jgi:hypothetical protein